MVSIKLKDVWCATYGTGLWSDKVRSVKIYKAEIVYLNEECDFGELRVYFTKKSWDVNNYGLIYTDPGFIQWLIYYLNLELEDRHDGNDDINLIFEKDICYSEQGKQGDNYVSFDIGRVVIEALYDIAEEECPPMIVARKVNDGLNNKWTVTPAENAIQTSGFLSMPDYAKEILEELKKINEKLDKMPEKKIDMGQQIADKLNDYWKKYPSIKPYAIPYIQPDDGYKPTDPFKYLPQWNGLDDNTDHPCTNCPNSPFNGGTGVCICSLPDMWMKRTMLNSTDDAE